MSISEVLILSIVEGLTEFLPVSSTAHLTLAAQILSLPQSEFLKSFEIAIQLGAILAVVCLYFKELTKSKFIWKKIIVSFIPTAIIGFAFYKLVKTYLLGNEFITALALILGGIAFILIEKYLKNRQSTNLTINDLGFKSLAFIGLFQSLSLIPGVSRAAASIFGGLIVGLNKTEAAKFSFFLAIPTMASATAFDLYKTSSQFSQEEVLILFIGFTASFITALMAVKFFINFIRKFDFYPFGLYRIVIGLWWLMYIIK